MKLDEVRERFLKFFEAKGHVVYPSDSLIPSNDPSLLFTGAGMNQFKDMFLGRGTLPFKTATTSQKCLRTGDLDKVGKTPGHHTFFEMLGNFSFGDYFKPQAIPWHWELMTREYKIPAERLFVSVYTDDDEAATIWRETVGLPEHRITRLGAEDNFWPANAPTEGPNGPCGPCSEIYYDFGPKYGCGSPTCGVGCGCNRYVEVANLVFTQFDRQDDGALQPLPQKNIDTGTGLERLAAVLQGVPTNFMIDVFVPIIEAEKDLLKVQDDPGPEALARLRRIADHVRALVFCIADNALPSNEGRGYVVRRVLRTALRDGVKLGHDRAFLHKLVPTVTKVMKPAYPYLVERERTVKNIIKSEEEAFLDTIHRGTAILEEEIARLSGRDRVVSGAVAFRLYDESGFPIEITEEVARENGVRVDRADFERRLKEKSEGTDAGTSADIFGKGALGEVKRERETPTKFLGYEIAVADLGKPVEAKVTRIIRLNEAALQKFGNSKRDLAAVSVLLNSGELIDEANKGDEVAVLCDRTPFYAESGGQVGDTGRIDFEGGSLDVRDARRPDDYFFHFGKIAGGTLKKGAKVRITLDVARRLDIMRNHTATHILQYALRKVLGTHVEQAGSVVEPDRLRFDFTHFQAMTTDEIRKVEDECNAAVLADLPVAKEEASMAEAKKRGAIAFFGEKYGEQVRMVTIGDKVSIELCGGTHLERTGMIGQVRITSEASIQRGVRRIEATTGFKAVELTRALTDEINNIAGKLGCPRHEVERKIAQLQSSLQELRQEISRLKRSGGGAAEIDQILAEAREIAGEKIVTRRIDDRKVEELRKLVDALVKKKKLGAALLAWGGGEKPVFIIGVREDLAKKGLKAGVIAREIGKLCGGGGGGKDHMAQAGASDPSKIEAAFSAFAEQVEKGLK